MEKSVYGKHAKDAVLTCQTRGKLLKFTIIKRMHKNFHIEEGTKVSASTSFPGSVSKVSGILFSVAYGKLPRSIDCGPLEVSRSFGATVPSQEMRFFWKYRLQVFESLTRSHSDPSWTCHVRPTRMVCFTLREGIELHVSRPTPSPMSAQLVDPGAFESQDPSARHCMRHVIGECQEDRRHNTPLFNYRTRDMLVERWEPDRQCCPLRTEFGRGWAKGNIHGPRVVGWLGCREGRLVNHRKADPAAHMMIWLHAGSLWCQ